ncbi:trypsin-like serine peptidase [Kitasatospora sp. NPDC092286]|uniref:trypsin-like serine peptidase n=1 Tax=Kitasatospora sp. NPDC092286 TaxID=3364087 RepID=UPI00380B3C0E
MGQHRRRNPRRRLLAPVLFTALAALTAATVVAGTHGVTSEATAVGSPPPAVTAPAVPPPAAPSTAGDPPSPTTEPTPTAEPTPSDEASAEDPSLLARASAPTAAPTTVRAGTTAEAQATPEAATVGALFSGGVGPGNHFCTASVLHSPTGNLLLTAAHCLGGADGVTFAPGYHNGTAPYGTWRVTAVHTAAGWSQNGDQDEDFAILETAPSNGRRIEDVVGANQLGTDEPFGSAVRLYGYPADSEAPILCANTTGRESAYQRVVDCPDYPGGTSGGPWISTATGHVIGTIGGYQQGGDTSDTSYSAYFDHTVADLYTEAEAAAS